MTLRKFGPYEIREVLGSGGMGTVYRGVQEGTGREVAVKVLSPSLLPDDTFRDRFESEIKSLEKLRHPRIVELYGFGEQDGQMFYAMELVRGSSLQEELTAGRRFYWREVIQIGIDVCGALKHAHDHGVIHRDIKPANLILDQNDQVRLTDFGIAKLFGNTSQTIDGGVLGTADYMAPEQAEGATVTPRSDIYSLGAVLYTLLASRPPFQGKSLPEVIHKVRFDPPLPVRRFAPETPEEIEELLDQLLAKDPRQRTPTALALSKRLASIEHALSLAPPAKPTIKPVADDMEDQERSASAAAEFAAMETAAALPSSFDHDATHLAAISIVESEQDSEEASVMRPQSNRYTTVDEDYRRRLGAGEETVETPMEFLSKWLSLIGLLTGGAVLIWFLTRPPSADQMYVDFQAAVETGSDDKLIAYEDEMQEFLRRFPDETRHGQVTNWLADIELAQLNGRFERIARSAITPRNIRPIEQLLLKAIRTEATDQVSAARQLQGIVALFPTTKSLSDEDRLCVTVAQRRLLQIKRIGSGHQEQQRDLAVERLKFAAEIAKDDPEAARRIRQGIVDLYQGDLWAQEYVNEARRLLAE